MLLLVDWNVLKEFVIYLLKKTFFIKCKTTNYYYSLFSSGMCCLSYLKFLWTSETQQFCCQLKHTFFAELFRKCERRRREKSLITGKYSFINGKHLPAGWFLSILPISRSTNFHRNDNFDSKMQKKAQLLKF